MTSPLLRISGANFSGRSKALLDSLLTEGLVSDNFFVGPYGESGLSGVATTVAEELQFYRDRSEDGEGYCLLETTEHLRRQRVATLSGGQQVLLALQCFENSRSKRLGLDGALEQLDAVHRTRAMEWIALFTDQDRCAVLVDNRWSSLDGFEVRELGGCKFEVPAISTVLPPITVQRAAPVLEVDHLTFAYKRCPDVLVHVCLELHPGQAYRLVGPNGSGKSTFLKLLAGVLKPQRGELRLDGMPYWPHREGNQVLALATQDPDHQWVATTFAADLGRRLLSFSTSPYAVQKVDVEALCASMLPQAARSMHLLDMPKALRKRLSWLWPLSGALPWLALDEPTLGQDTATVRDLEIALSTLLERGHGLLFVSHDERLGLNLPHHTLAFTAGNVSLVKTKAQIQ